MSADKLYTCVKAFSLKKLDDDEREIEIKKGSIWKQDVIEGYVCMHREDGSWLVGITPTEMTEHFEKVSE